MADKQLRRDQKRKAKKRNRSKATTQRVRQRRARNTDVGRWPLGDAYASHQWPDRGATVQVVFTRCREDNLVAAAFLTLDLLERGVTKVDVRHDLDQMRLGQELSRRAENDPMSQVDAALVVKLIEEATRHGQSNGHSQPEALRQVRSLFGTVDASNCTHEILCGEEPPKPPKETWVGAIKRRFGRGS